MHLYSVATLKHSISYDVQLTKNWFGWPLNDMAPYIDEFNQHLCRAAIAAYTAPFYAQDKTELCGETEESIICLPFIDSMAHANYDTGGMTRLSIGFMLINSLGITSKVMRRRR